MYRLIKIATSYKPKGIPIKSLIKDEHQIYEKEELTNEAINYY